MKTLLYIGLAALLLVSCSVRAKFNKANQTFEEGGYYKAAKSYKTLSSKSSLTKKLNRDEIDLLNFRLGESYRITGKYKEAQAAYERMFRRHTPELPEVYLRYGQVLMCNNDYDRASEQLLLYKKYEPDNRFVDSLLAAVTWAKSNPAQSKYTVSAVTSLNSRNNDYAPAYASGDYEVLYFTSSRKANKSRIYDVTGEPASNLYASVFSRRGAWGKPFPVDEETLKSKQEDGACAFNSDYTLLYFTRCGKVKREKKGCSIFTAQRKDDLWEEPVKLPITDDSVTVAHPSLSADELTLYFASDLPGGYGGMDIWKVTRSNEADTWGEPINMGAAINTGGNEMFPFARNGGNLYFASDGHVGLGGLDIFKATPDGAGWVVENMGEPLNSPADDFAIIFERDNERGFFTSNRKASEKASRNDDNLYAFTGESQHNVEFYFSALVKNAKTNAMLPASDVRLVGSNGVSLRRKTGDNGQIEFRVDKGTDYLVVASHKGYLNGKTRFSSHGWTDGYSHRDTILLTPTDKPIEIPNIFFEFGKAALTDNSRAALDILITIMNDNPTLVIELRAHTDNRGSDETNYAMSQQRAQAVVDYLIKHAIDEGRMDAVGLGESQPKVVDTETARQYPFLRIGARLDERYINSLKSEEERDICHLLNRRTEFQVLDDNYVPQQ
ncbi:MAG: OmpA family protein [Prevotellaceae bacterium]|jgi:peptidoglycan-associated lipoprotein|nr:OmpA family protein [Prevotellaceae bacterium]